MKERRRKRGRKEVRKKERKKLKEEKKKAEEEEEEATLKRLKQLPRDQATYTATKGASDLHSYQGSKRLT